MVRDIEASPLKQDGAPLRILVVVHDFQPGGVERISLRLAAQWAADGAQVAIACGDSEGALRSLASDEVQLFTPAKPLKRSRFSRIAVAAFAVRAAREFAPDIIFLPGNFYTGMAVTLKLRLGRRGPAIVVRLSNVLRRPRRSPARGAAYLVGLAIKSAFADHIVTMSPELLEEARRSLRCRPARLSVIAEPVLDAGPAKVPEQSELAGDEPPLLVAAGRLVRQKNFGLLLDAAARLDRPFRLVIYGEGLQRAQLEKDIAARGLADRTVLPGYVDDLWPALCDARLFVLSSDYEGFPAVLIEALAAGVPIVATDCSPAIAGIVAMGDGILVPVGDPAALAHAIDESLDRPRPDRRRLAASVEGYRLDRTAAAYLELFTQLVRANQGRRRPWH
ncbi:MAG TPA: glycosyltransferase [Sphingomicrobium sp.]|nr:glycosyltransferase [Sphingomicrobium sp.]